MTSVNFGSGPELKLARSVLSEHVGAVSLWWSPKGIALPLHKGEREEVFCYSKILLRY